MTTPDGEKRTMRLYARGSALGLGELTDTETSPSPNSYAFAPTATPTRAVATAGTTTTDSPTHRLNRSRLRLHPRRNDAESINRDLDDTLYFGRA